MAINKLATGLTNITRTENNAVTHRSTLDPVLDFFYHAPAKRGQNIETLFYNAYSADPVLAVTAAFYLRDIRGGQGERELFRQCLQWLYDNDRRMFSLIVHLVPEYGRWDDMLAFYEYPFVVEMIRARLNEDYVTERPSLLAKWMPSENTSSKATRDLARKWITALGTNAKHYRRRLSKIRATIKIVESQMSAGKWADIDYSRVPSRASMNYRKAFAKRDTTRYSAFLEAVKAGKTKINSSALYPYELVSKYTIGQMVDPTIEAQWQALPDYCDGRSFLVVCDTSGSMTCGNGNPAPIDVAVSLAIYAAERAKGPFKDMWINFNDKATAYKLQGATLRDRVHAMVNNNDWGGSTNLQSAFDLILRTAKLYKVAPEDMPEMLFVVSDMEFNPTGMFTNHEKIKAKYAASGYMMPTLVFWNVASRAMQAPVTVDENGVYLVSGCSPTVFKNALTTTAITPRDMMLDVLNSKRYDKVREVLHG